MIKATNMQEASVHLRYFLLKYFPIQLNSFQEWIDEFYAKMATNKKSIIDFISFSGSTV